MRGVLFPALLLAPALGGLAAVIPFSGGAHEGLLSAQQISLASSSSSPSVGAAQIPPPPAQESSNIIDEAAQNQEGNSKVEVEFKPPDLRKELAELEALKAKLPKLEEEIAARARWLGQAADKLCGIELTPGSCSGGKLVCAVRKVFGLRSGNVSVRKFCFIEKPGLEAEDVPVPPWRERGAEDSGVVSGWAIGIPEGEGNSLLVDLLLSGWLEGVFLFVGVVVVGWCLLGMWRREKEQKEGEGTAINPPVENSVRRSPSRSRVFEWMQCWGGSRRSRRGYSDLESPRPSCDEKLAGFGESERYLAEGSVNGEVFVIDDLEEEEEEEEVFAREVVIDEGRLVSSQQEEERIVPFPAWGAPRYQNEDAGDQHVADGFTYTAGVELPDSEGSETEAGSENVSETGSVSEVDSLEGLTLGDEVASFREAFGLVEDMVAAFEQRRSQT